VELGVSEPAIVIPFTNDTSGLRDYRAHVTHDHGHTLAIPHAVVLGLVFGLGLVLGYGLSVSVLH
jgi:uncharacterized membrane protein YedE/YeeE